MALETQKVIDLNVHFYNTLAGQFARSRVKPWAGWTLLLKYIKASCLIADIGCGDGRFLTFLLNNNINCAYTGYDTSAELINLAKKEHAQANFYTFDVIQNKLPRNYDVVCAFGLVHHIPNQKALYKTIKNISAVVNKQGLVIITIWKFNPQKEKTFNIKSRELGISLEKGDFLLDWGGTGVNLRFCHLYDRTEIENLIKHFERARFSLIDQFDADKENTYLVFKKLV
ncbi:class I SAM-dependent methyltransferase [candidate division WWE3 bacterium]|uniref:Class I SAM-dependent methyltransferase n=1 Tax=candidate division WWE3 bacterium TaxID=2053526 RepID=A0A7X9DL83_UNCKA|nr:class I SAM-dependent methyltransferase [candidate division WWE3 bacterium]